MPEQIWFYENDGSYAGPVSEAHIKNLIAAGQISRSTLLWTAGLSQWKPACSYFEFATLVPPPLPQHSEEERVYARQKGAAAYLSGRGLDTNPHRDSSSVLEKCWDDGWNTKKNAESGYLKEPSKRKTGATPPSKPQQPALYRKNSAANEGHDYGTYLGHAIIIALIFYALRVFEWEAFYSAPMPPEHTGFAVVQASVTIAIAALIAKWRGKFVRRLWQVAGVWICLWVLSFMIMAGSL